MIPRIGHRFFGQDHAQTDSHRADGASVPGVAAIVVMGVSGAGKSTVGKLIAARLGCPFRDADSFHPHANIEKMSRGEALTDEDRWPWLRAIAAWIGVASRRLHHRCGDLLGAPKRATGIWSPTISAPTCGSFISRAISI